MQLVLETLKEAGIQIIASTISDTVDFGIYRIICSDPSNAYRILREKGLSVTLSDVFAIELDNTPGQAADAMQTFAKANISINYMYSFLVHGKGVLIFRADDAEKARELIVLSKLNFLTPDQIRDISSI